jgi:hypothetical protein
MTNATMPRNIRFWAYVNGCYVKITLRYGDALPHYEGGATEEGYDVGKPATATDA